MHLLYFCAGSFPRFHAPFPWVREGGVRKWWRGSGTGFPLFWGKHFGSAPLAARVRVLCWSLFPGISFPRQPGSTVLVAIAAVAQEVGPQLHRSFYGVSGSCGHIGSAAAATRTGAGCLGRGIPFECIPLALGVPRLAGAVLGVGTGHFAVDRGEAFSTVLEIKPTKRNHKRSPPRGAAHRETTWNGQLHVPCRRPW